MPRVLTASPEAISPKASFETPSEHATRPEGQAESHPLRNLLRNLLRSYLRKVPPVPSAERKTSPSGYFPSPPRVPEYPKPGESPRMTPELAICPRVPEP